jgi:hypothetical protein
MGAWFGSDEKLIIDDEIVWPLGATIETHYHAVDLQQLPKYSAVLIAHGGGKKLSDEETATLEQWVASGGTLIVSGNALYSMWASKLPAWVGGEGAAPWYVKAGLDMDILQPDHPLVQGLKDLNDKGVWHVSSGINSKDGVSLIGNGKNSMLFENPHGKGRVIYVEYSFIPHQRARAQSHDANGIHITLNLTPLMQRFWSNLVTYLQIPTRYEVIDQWAKASGSKDAIAVWWRYEADKAMGGAAYNPPYPHADDEWNEVRFDVGIDERDRQRFFVTTRRDIGSLTVAPTDLVSQSGKKIGASQLKIFLQGKPLPDYPKASYWLVDPQHVEPLGSAAVRVRSDETYTYWIVLDSSDATPGKYTGKLEFRSGSTLLKALPVHVEVWPLHQPGADVLHFELEHNWFSMPGGYYIREQRNDPDLLKKYQDSLGNLGVDFGQTSGGYEKGYYLSSMCLRENGQLLEKAIAENPTRFRQDPLPALSLSGLYDVWWNNAIAAGLRNFSQAWLLSADAPLYLARKIYGDETIAIGSPRHLRIAKWYYGEYQKYLRERGLLDTYIKSMDEFGPDKIPDYIRSAEVMRAAGFKTYTTTYNLIQNKDAIAEIDPYLDMWQIGWPLDNPRDFFKKQGVAFDPKNEVWGTASNSIWSNTIDEPRGFGWEAARLRMEGLHIHGYMRWWWNEVEGAFVGPDGPFDSVAVTSYGQGVSEGRYLAQLLRMIDEAKASGRGAAVARQLEAEILRKIIGVPTDGSTPLIPLNLTETTLGGIKTQEARPEEWMSPQNFVAAKVEVFKMLLRLQKAMGDSKPDVSYDVMPLVRNGEPVSRIVCGSEVSAAKILADGIAKLGEVHPSVTPTSSLQAGDDKVVVVVGTLKSNAVLADLVRQELATEITPFYPPVGAYAVRRLAASKNHPAILLIVGGDSKGAEIGASNLVHLLTVRNRW